GGGRGAARGGLATARGGVAPAAARVPATPAAVATPGGQQHQDQGEDQPETTGSHGSFSSVLRDGGRGRQLPQTSRPPTADAANGASGCEGPGRSLGVGGAAVRARRRPTRAGRDFPLKSMRALRARAIDSPRRGRDSGAPARSYAGRAGKPGGAGVQGSGTGETVRIPDPCSPLSGWGRGWTPAGRTRR